MVTKKIAIGLLLFSVGLGASGQNNFDKNLQRDKNFAKYLFKDKDQLKKEYKEFLELNNKGLLNLVISYLGTILSVAEDAAFAILTPVQEIIKQNSAAIYENPFRNMGASVRIGEPIGPQELLFREERFPIVKSAQEKMLGIELADEDVLEVGFSCSGGGWRAMCCAAGSFVGADKIGLVDTAMYASTLSGSTWFMGPWIYSGMDIHDYRKRLIDVASTGIKIKSPKEAETIFDNVWVKLAFNQPLNVIDIYGALLANSLLRGLTNDPHRVYLTDQRQVIDKGKFPLPVYTAVLGEPDTDEFWFEFTPYEIGTRWLNAYVPTWAFGRHFKGGNSKSFAPEQYLGFMMGIFGSAFAADMEDIYDALIKDAKLPGLLKDIPFAESIFKAIKSVFASIAYTTDMGDMRIAWARVPNFVYKLDGVERNNKKEFQLVDAGLDINNPVFAAYRKPPYGSAPDILFVFDSGASVNFNELQAMMDYAKYHGLKFPKIEPFDVGKSTIYIFKDDTDLEVPVVVYMPRINGLTLLDKSDYKNVDSYYVKMLDGFDMEKAVSSGFAKTFSFDYTKKDAETLMAMTEYNIVSVKDKIKQVMKDRIDLKRKIREKKK